MLTEHHTTIFQSTRPVTRPFLDRLDFLVALKCAVKCAVSTFTMIFKTAE